MDHLTFLSTKTFEHAFSCAFRQHKATHSHCSKQHGYALSVKFVFEAKFLDKNNWVVDFGDMKDLKKELEDLFDHKTVIAEDDPHLDWFKEAEKREILDLVILPNVGCEKFAEKMFEVTEAWMQRKNLLNRCNLVQVEVFEHGANSAIFRRS